MYVCDFCQKLGCAVTPALHAIRLEHSTAESYERWENDTCMHSSSGGHCFLLLSHWSVLGRIVGSVGSDDTENFKNMRSVEIRPGHVVNRPGHVVNRPGHVVNRPGHVVNRPGHVVKLRPGRPVIFRDCRSLFFLASLGVLVISCDSLSGP